MSLVLLTSSALASTTANSRLSMALTVRRAAADTCSVRSGTRRCRTSTNIPLVSVSSSGCQCCRLDLYVCSEIEEPKFGKPPKIDPYAEVKKAKKYFS